MIDEDRSKFIQESGAVIEGHFVYKAGYAHGNLYINKEEFPEIGARKLVRLIRQVGANALALGLDFGNVTRVGIIGPAYGAIPFSLPLAAYFEEQRPDILFFPARTQLVKDKETGRDIHVIPDKLLKRYKGGAFIIHEDVVNNGTTIRETAKLFRDRADARIIAATCFADRNAQSTKTLGVEQYYPYYAKKMEQHDIREEPCPLCAANVPITLEPGKGKEWVEMFSQPPYPADMDFSAFWADS